MKEQEKIKDVISKLKDLSTMGSGTVISSAIYGIFWFYMAGLLGTENYGHVNYYLSISTITAYIALLGSDNSLLVYVTKDNKIVPAILLLTIISGFIASVTLFFIFNNLAMSLFVIGSVLFGLVSSLMLAKKSYKNFSLYSICQRLLLIPISIGLYYLMGINGIILGMAVASLVFSFVLYKELRKFKINLSVLKKHSNFIGTSYVYSLSRTASGYIDRLIVFPMFGYSLLGNYSLGLQFLTILGLLPQIVYQYILPHDAGGISNRKIKIGTVIASIAISILSIILAPIVLPYFFPKFSDSIEIVQITSMGIIPISINFMYISKFLGNGMVRAVTIGSGIYLTTQILGIVLLGKVEGISGVAWALDLSACLESLYLIILNRMKTIKRI